MGFWSDHGTWPQVQAYRDVVFESGLAEIAGLLTHSQTVTAMSGLRFIAGSHHWGRRFVRRFPLVVG